MKSAIRKKMQRDRGRAATRTHQSRDRSRRPIREPKDARVKERPQRNAVKTQPKNLVEQEIDVKEITLSAPDARALVYSRAIDKIDKDLGLSASLQKQPHLSTGLLALDLCLGHGFVPGFNVFFGAEQSAKSTASITTLGESLLRNIPVRKYFDAEGAVDRRYAGNILRTTSFDAVFGMMDRKGSWIKPPLCRYHDTNIIEEVFRDIHRVCQFMPNKVFRPEIGESGEWFLVFDRTKPQMALLKELGLIPDKTLFTKTGKYWCSTGLDDDAPQGILFIDSLPSLIPQAISEETMSDKAMAIDARFLGKYMKLVRGSLRAKGVVLLAVNQLRSNPGAGPGQADWYEPAGNAVKFCSDTRTMFTSRVPMDNFPRFKDNKGLCDEASVEYDGGTDMYAFKGMTNIKNKYGTPGRKTRARVWIKDGAGAPRGFDPVYDVYVVLDELDLINGPIHDSRRSFRINVNRIKDVEFKWPAFKAMILAEVSGSKKLWAKARELGAPKFNLRAYCKHLIDTGKSEELLAAAAKRQRAKAVSIDLEADDEE